MVCLEINRSLFNTTRELVRTAPSTTDERVSDLLYPYLVNVFANLVTKHPLATVRSPLLTEICTLKALKTLPQL